MIPSNKVVILEEMNIGAIISHQKEKNHIYTLF